jgi:hypothetical protein
MQRVHCVALLKQKGGGLLQFINEIECTSKQSVYGYLSLKYLTRSQMMIGRFSLSLYVGSSTEYLSSSAIIEKGEGHKGECFNFIFLSVFLYF